MCVYVGGRAFYTFPFSEQMNVMPTLRIPGTPGSSVALLLKAYLRDFPGGPAMAKTPCFLIQGAWGLVPGQRT